MTRQPLDLTAERASEIRRLRNAGRRILYAMAGIEDQVAITRERVENSMRRLGVGDTGELPLEVEHGLILYVDYDGTYNDALGWRTGGWAWEVDKWCDRNGVERSAKPFPRRRDHNDRSRRIADMGWEVEPERRRKKIFKIDQWRAALAAYRASVESRVQVLEDQLLLLGRGPSASNPAAQRGWELIRHMGAFGPDMFRGLIETIETRTTKKQIRDSIAASKELLEGVMRGVLRDHGYTDTEITKLKVGPLFDACRDLLFADGDRVLTDRDYALGRILSGTRDMVIGLTELRNGAGGGHGRTAYAQGLTSSHAAFVGDTAYALCALVAEQHLRVGRGKGQGSSCT